MFQSENLQEKWQPVLDHPDLPEMKDQYKRAVTSVILENQEKHLREERQFLGEAVPNNSASGAAVDNWNPILISLVRRAMPHLIAYDVCGVQPMTGPTGLIFAMRSQRAPVSGSAPNEVSGAIAQGETNEALHDEVDTDFSASDVGGGTAQTGTNPGKLNDSPSATSYTARPGMALSAAEALGDGSAGTAFSEMGFSIEQSTVTAKSRGLKAEYSMELAQDLKAIHGLDAETELSNILSSEILAEINREVIRTIYFTSKKGADGASTPGIFDLDVDSNGRWSVEKFKGMLFQVDRDANAIGVDTRRGTGNIVMCSADVASAMQMAGVLDYAPAISNNLTVDTTGNTFAGTLMGKYKVYVDPYASPSGNEQWFVVGYKGSVAYDAGLFYCPYVPLQMVRAIGENSFQPKIGFKTRYGMARNPFAEADATAAQTMSANANRYYRRVKVANLM